MLKANSSKFAGVRTLVLAAALLALALTAVPEALTQEKNEAAKPQASADSSSTLQNMDSEIADIAAKVMPAIVQIDVSGFGPADEESGDTSVLTRQRALGSGVIVDPDGYIVTNAHVVAGAQSIQVLVIPTNALFVPQKTSFAFHQQSYPAKLIGINRVADLAIIKIEATNLPVLPLKEIRDYRVRLGEIVMAIGSPLGLDHTITRGIISAVGRQPDANRAMVYVQTDAPINPGNSGGALVDRNGNLVGINTFIYTKGGGSEGLGFAIPEPLVRHFYDEIRKYGRVRENYIGATMQTITPNLAAGLGLPQDFGIIVSDVVPDSPAEKGGLQAGDIVVSMDGRAMDSLPLFVSTLYLHPEGMPAPVQIIRAGAKQMLMIEPVEGETSQQLSDLVDQNSLMPELGVFVLDMTKPVMDNLSGLRSRSGVVVAARVDYEPQVDTDLQAGDVIVAINNRSISSVSDLRSLLAQKKPGDPITARVEREGAYRYVTFQME